MARLKDRAAGGQEAAAAKAKEKEAKKAAKAKEKEAKKAAKQDPKA